MRARSETFAHAGTAGPATFFWMFAAAVAVVFIPMAFGVDILAGTGPIEPLVLAAIGFSASLLCLSTFAGMSWTIGPRHWLAPIGQAGVLFLIPAAVLVFVWLLAGAVGAVFGVPDDIVAAIRDLPPLFVVIAGLALIRIGIALAGGEPFRPRLWGTVLFGLLAFAVLGFSFDWTGAAA